MNCLGFYVSAGGKEYSQQTLRSLAVVDESLINYDLIEALVCHVLASPQVPALRETTHTESLSVYISGTRYI